MSLHTAATWGPCQALATAFRGIPDERSSPAGLGPAGYNSGRAGGSGLRRPAEDWLRSNRLRAAPALPHFSRCARTSTSCGTSASTASARPTGPAPARCRCSATRCASTWRDGFSAAHDQEGAHEVDRPRAPLVPARRDQRPLAAGGGRDDLGRVGRRAGRARARSTATSGGAGRRPTAATSTRWPTSSPRSGATRTRGG